MISSRGRGEIGSRPDDDASGHASNGLIDRAFATPRAEPQHATEISGSSWTTGGFLETLPPRLRDSLTQGAGEVTHASGWLIHGRDERARPGVILDGLVRAYFSSPDGREATIAYLRPGHAIGLVGVFAPAQAMSLQAVVHTTVRYFDERRFGELLSTEAALGHAVAASLADYIVAWSHSFHGYVFATVRVRIAAHLLALASPDEQGPLVAELTQQGLANAVGSVRDVVARVLHEMQREGLVMCRHKRVVLTDIEGLEREAWPVLTLE